MTPPLSAEFLYVEEDALAGNQALRRNVLVMRYAALMPFFMAFVFLIFGAIVELNSTRPASGRSFLIMSPIFVLVGFLLRWRLAQAARSAFRKSPHAGKTIRWRFDAERAHINTELSESSFAWKALLEVKEVEAGFLLFSHPRYAHWIPRRAFGAEENLDAFRDILRTAGLKFHRSS